MEETYCPKCKETVEEVDDFCPSCDARRPRTGWPKRIKVVTDNY